MVRGQAKELLPALQPRLLPRAGGTGNGACTGTPDDGQEGGISEHNDYGAGATNQHNSAPALQLCSDFGGVVGEGLVP